MHVVKAETAYADKRGNISDLLNFKQPVIDSVTRIRSFAGAIRGNHYHKETAQWTYIVKGKTRVVTVEADKRQEEICCSGDTIHHRPGEAHAFEALEDTEWLVFTKGPRSGKDYESDTFRLETPLI